MKKLGGQKTFFFFYGCSKEMGRLRVWVGMVLDIDDIISVMRL